MEKDIMEYYEKLMKDISITSEESLYRNFFKEYKMKAKRMSNDQCYDIYMGVYVPFALNGGKQMKGVKCLFNTLEDWFRISHAVDRVNELRKIDEFEYMLRFYRLR